MKKPPAARRSEFEHWIHLKVRWGDTDAMQHVNNGRFLSYLEMGRIEYMGALGLPRDYEKRAEGPLLVRVECNFRQQIFFPSEIEVAPRIVELRRRSYVMKQAIFQRGTEELMADGFSVLAWVNYPREQSLRLPAEVRAIISKREKIPSGVLDDEVRNVPNTPA